MRRWLLSVLLLSALVAAGVAGPPARGSSPSSGYKAIQSEQMLRARKALLELDKIDLGRLEDQRDLEAGVKRLGRLLRGPGLTTYKDVLAPRKPPLGRLILEPKQVKIKGLHAPEQSLLDIAEDKHIPLWRERIMGTGGTGKEVEMAPPARTTATLRKLARHLGRMRTYLSAASDLNKVTAKGEEVQSLREGLAPKVMPASR